MLDVTGLVRALTDPPSVHIPPLDSACDTADAFIYDNRYTALVCLCCARTLRLIRRSILEPLASPRSGCGSLRFVGVFCRPKHLGAPRQARQVPPCLPCWDGALASLCFDRFRCRNVSTRSVLYCIGLHGLFFGIDHLPTGHLFATRCRQWRCFRRPRRHLHLLRRQFRPAAAVEGYGRCRCCRCCRSRITGPPSAQQRPAPSGTSTRTAGPAPATAACAIERRSLPAAHWWVARAAAAAAAAGAAGAGVHSCGEGHPSAQPPCGGSCAQHGGSAGCVSVVQRLLHTGTGTRLVGGLRRSQPLAGHNQVGWH